MKITFLQVATLSTAFIAPVAAQTPILWNGSLDNLTAGDWSNATNWAGSNIPDADTELANFRANWTGTAPSVTLGADYTVNGIQFDDTGTGTDLALTINAGNTITLAGTAPAIQIDSGTLTIAATLAGSTDWTKSINPEVGLLAGTTGALTLTGDSPSATGAVTVATGNLNLGTATVATGSLPGASSFTVRNGTLALTNTIGNSDRIGDSSTLNLTLGGTISLVHNPTTDTAETIGALNLVDGRGIVSVSSAASRVTTLAATSLSRGSNKATALLRGTSLGQTVATNVARITFGNGAALLTSDGVGATTLNNGATSNSDKTIRIIPWLHGDTGAAGAGNGFVTYDTTLGVRVLTAAQNTVMAAGYTTAGTLENVSATGTLTLTNAAGITVNSLTLRAVTTLDSTNVNPLTIASGAVGTDNANSARSIGSGFSKLSLQNGEGFFHIAANTTTVSTPVEVTGTGSGGITKSGGGTLALTAANLYSGPTTVNAGILTLSGVSSNDTKIYIRGGQVNFNTIGNVGSGTSALGTPSNEAQGTIELGGTLLFNGTAAASSDRSINLQPYPDARFSQLNNGATGGTPMLSLSGAVTGDGNLLVRGAGGDITLSGVVSNNGSISHTEARTLFLQNAANNFSGPLLIFAGTVSVATVSDIGVISAIGAGSSIGLGQASTSTNTGTFQFTGSSGGSTNRPVIVTNNGVIQNTVAGQTLSLSGGFSVGVGTTDATPTLRLNGAGDGLQRGSITGTGFEIIKEGAGTWTLSGTGSYTGITNVTAGTLRINGDHSAAAGAITVSGGATLGGTGTSAAAITATSATNGGANVAPGFSTGTLTAASANLSGGGNLVITLAAAASSKLSVSGLLDITGTDLVLSGTGSGSPQVIASYGTLTGTFASVPPGYTVDYAYNDGASANNVAITLTDSYLLWAAAKGLTAGNNAKTADPEGDGVVNGLEFYLDGNPLSGDAPSITSSTVGGNLRLTFKRRDDAESLTVNVETSTTMTVGSWVTLTHGVDGVVINVTENGAAPDDVEVLIPATNSRLFARLLALLP